MSIYVLDANVVSDMLRKIPDATIMATIAQHRQDDVYLCMPVDYEIRRGLIKTQAFNRLQYYESHIKPQFQWVSILDEDWVKAAELWSIAVSAGKQLSDIDLLIAAVTLRLGGTLVSADSDFDSLPVTRVNWRLET
jgi:tRNA(fMet)-specific endonuclease VapC